jgi:hypothetical protein
MKRIKITFGIAFTCLMILSCSFVAQAQSGRRQQRVEPAAPIPTPTPEPTLPTKSEKKEPDLILFVGADRNGSFSSFPYSYYDAAVIGCSDGLRKNASASVDFSTRELTRSDAIRKAKSDSKTYVIYLQLRSDSMAGTTNQTSDIQLEFTVFAPSSAKVITSGTSYLNARRAGPVILGPPGGGSTSMLYREQLLKRAGEDAAERILKSLHLNDPVRTN